MAEKRIDETEFKKTVNLLQGYIKNVKEEASAIEKSGKNLHNYASKIEESLKLLMKEKEDKLTNKLHLHKFLKNVNLTGDGTTVYIKGFSNMMTFGAEKPLSKENGMYFEVEFTNFK
ncbi:unnamed protein product [Meloidogyne enterolobii]|uniref:Uncharacterized protein n=2 Tax=Meloidogyne enterolobii TaxID=390850 RepID=A0ACB0Z0K5_MELEN